MNVLLKEKLQTNKSNLKDIKMFIDLEEEKLNVHKQYINDIKTKNKERIKTIKSEIDKSESSIARLELSIDKSNEKVRELQATIDDEDDTRGKLKKIKDIYN